MKPGCVTGWVGYRIQTANCSQCGVLVSCLKPFPLLSIFRRLIDRPRAGSAEPYLEVNTMVSPSGEKDGV